MPGRWRERRHIGKVDLSNHKSEGLGEQKAGSGQKGACPLMTPRLGDIAGTMPMSQGPILRGLRAAPHFIYACQEQGWVRSPLEPRGLGQRFKLSTWNTRCCQCPLHAIPWTFRPHQPISIQKPAHIFARLHLPKLSSSTYTAGRKRGK